MTSSDSPAQAGPPDTRFVGPILSHNARFGLVLFLIYLAIYLGFILLSAWAKDFMARPSFGGVNVAILYGFGLIIAAFVLAMIYMIFCKPDVANVPDLTEGALAEEMQKEEGAA